MKYPKISVITPTLNQGEFIEQTILSVVNQEYPNFEHIIVDGGSTDNTIEILKKYPHLIWISEHDYGQSDAFNKGIKMATGEIIGWLNSDDIYLENTINTIVKKFATNSEIDIIYGDCYYIDENDKILRKYKSEEFNIKKLLICGYCYIHPMSTFIKKKVFNRLKYPLDTNLHYCMDHDFFLRVAEKGFKFKYVSVFLSCFRRSGKNKTSINIKDMRRESYMLSKRYAGKNILLYINYLLAKFYLYNTGVANFIRNIRYNLSFVSSRHKSIGNTYLRHTDYSQEPGGIRRLDFFMNCISEHQISQKIKSRDVRILDVGCGNGNITLPLASLGYNIEGFDINQESIEKAQEKNIFNNAIFKKCDIMELNNNKRYDVIIVSEVIEHLNNPVAILNTVRRLLKPQGLLLLSVPNSYSIEELIRRVTSNSLIGNKIKKIIRRYIMKKENVQSMADSPHINFYSLMSFKKLLKKTHFKLVKVKNGSVFFKGLFYLILRLFMKRGSKTFFLLNYGDDILAEIAPLLLGDSWLLKIELSKKSK